tara:strand:+ start:78 stop:344 length:267 start_codon:yes stop_codon:yes gene_type:complete
MNSYPYFDYPTLKKLNDKAISLNLNRSLEPSFFDDVSPDTLFPVTFSIDHNDGREARVRFVYNELADSEYLDLLMHDFLSLPRFTQEA